MTGDLAASTRGMQSILDRPLMIVLDSLSEEGTELFIFVKTWLQDLPSLNKVFETLMTHLTPYSYGKQSKANLDATTGTAARATSAVNDETTHLLYYLRHVLNVLRWSSEYTWATMADEVINAVDGTHGAGPALPIQQAIADTCLRILQTSNSSDQPSLSELSRVAVSVLQLVLLNPYSGNLRNTEFEVPLMSLLSAVSPSLQSLLLETITAALKLKMSTKPPRQPPQNERRKSSKDIITALARKSLSRDDGNEEEAQPESTTTPPPQLVECLKSGFSSASSRLILDDWVKFLAEVLPLYTDTIFQNLLPLVECLCRQIEIAFTQLQTVFATAYNDQPVSPESTIVSLMNGLEQILARAHDRLLLQESKPTATKSPEVPQGFFGNVVGVFSAETPNTTRSSTSNTRLTVLLCFQDTVRISFSIWSWGGYGSSSGRQDTASQASYGYASLRLRNRSRRMLEHLFAAEGLECLETIAAEWCQASKSNPDRAAAILGLLNVLNGSKPKHTIPAMFDAIYSRSNPAALDPGRMSTLTTDLSDTDLAMFLVQYIASLEDDAMDEIWTDCMTFLRDVLANPMPHRQILPALLEFTSMVAQKVDNTNFGEQKKMRRELGVSATIL
jgi:hypothetical protein